MKTIYENYLISDSGELFVKDHVIERKTTLKNKKEVVQLVKVNAKKLKPYVAKNGYKVHNIKGKVKYIHHMVYEAYIGPRKKGLTLNHRNGDKLNNNISNLEEVTYAQNNEHARMNGLNKVIISDYTIRKKVKAYKGGVLIGEYDSADQASKELNAHHVTCICKGKRKQSNGYTFSYA
jgi:hypothetical protein